MADNPLATILTPLLRILNGVAFTGEGPVERLLGMVIVLVFYLIAFVLGLIFGHETGLAAAATATSLLVPILHAWGTPDTVPLASDASTVAAASSRTRP